MQMRVGVVGCGIGIPKTNLEVSALNIGMLYFRRYPKDPEETILTVRDLLTYGGKSGTFLVTGIETDWFELDPKKDNWAHNTIWMIGKKIEVEVHGSQFLRGTVDVSVKVFDKYNQSRELVAQCCLKAGGIQSSSMKIRGVVCRSSMDKRNRMRK